MLHRYHTAAFQRIKARRRDSRNVEDPVFGLACDAALPEFTVIGLEAMAVGPDVWSFMQTQYSMHFGYALRNTC
jgi:hypothetical protein